MQAAGYVPLDFGANNDSWVGFQTERRLEGKLTGQITPKHNLAASYLDRSSQTTNNRFTATSYDLEQFSDREDPQELTSVFYNGVLTNNNTGAPSACGGSTTVTFTYTSTCAPLTTTCQATVTVSGALLTSPSLTISCAT